MWEGWTRVSSVLTPVSVTLSWMWGPTRDWAAPYLLRSSVRLRAELRGPFRRRWPQIATPPNNSSNVASTHRSPRGHKSQSHHPGMESSHRPPTCPPLVPAILFSVPPPLLSQILTSEYFRPQSQTLRSTLPGSRRDEASESPLRRRCTETPKAVGENSRPFIRNGAQQRHCVKHEGEGSSGQTKRSTPGGERGMGTRAVRTDTKGMLIYVTLDPFAASTLHYRSVLIPHRP